MDLAGGLKLGAGFLCRWNKLSPWGFTSALVDAQSPRRDRVGGKSLVRVAARQK
jgi:hypothetical protein